MREKIDLSSDISLLVAQLKRLAASKLGKKLELGELLFVDSKLAQAIIDIDAAVKMYGDKEIQETWGALKRRVIRKAALQGVKELSEASRLFIAGAAEREEEDGWG